MNGFKGLANGSIKIVLAVLEELNQDFRVFFEEDAVDVFGSGDSEREAERHNGIYDVQGLQKYAFDVVQSFVVQHIGFCNRNGPLAHMIGFCEMPVQPVVT